MGSVAVGIMCKTPAPGKSKTRLSPPLRPEECAGLSACFIRDLSRTIGRLAEDGDVTGHAVYTPVGSEELATVAAGQLQLMPQVSDFGVRLSTVSAICWTRATMASCWSIPTVRPCRCRSCAPRSRRWDEATMSC
jgi:glycosyltransferase A (GT-A) superfamily protein (DUF2064 family)